jgi:hypothetical protein
MRLLTASIFLLALGAPPAFAMPPTPSPSHPILGIWVLTMPDGSCSEVYRFRGDGTTIVTSAQEVTQSEFEIPEQPSAKGYYRLVDRVVKDNGKRDCAGEVMKAGGIATNFIRFHPSGSLFLMCATESMEVCIGPFRRVVGQGA